MRAAIFAHVPRTGGSSIREAFELGRGDIHLPAAELARRYPDRPRFTFVRDPWDRAASLYAFWYDSAPVDVDAFRRWVNAGLPHPSGSAPILYAGEPYAIDVRAPQRRWAEGATFVGRFERIDADAVELATWLGRPPPELGRTNASRPRAPLDLLYDSETVRRIATLYAEDAEWYGYQPPEPLGSKR